ncbi:MAG: hypothetical protein RBR82_15840 [Pseudomonas sp.]|nr:hypothetical protein [Pseudomonas sp.]
MEPAHLDLLITPGETWRKPLKIMQPVYEYKPITSINQTAPLTLTVNHGLPLDHWPVWIEASTSSTLNTDKTLARPRMVRAIDPQTVELNGINGHSINAAGGYLVYQLPVDFTGCTASMVFKGQHDDIELTEISGLSIGLGYIDAELTAEQSLLLRNSSIYQLWVAHPNGDKVQWLCGGVSINDCKNNSAC